MDAVYGTFGGSRLGLETESCLIDFGALYFLCSFRFMAKLNTMRQGNIAPSAACLWWKSRKMGSCQAPTCAKTTGKNYDFWSDIYFNFAKFCNTLMNKYNENLHGSFVSSIYFHLLGDLWNCLELSS